MSANNPRLHPAILISPVEGGYVAYDPGTDKLHQLNPTAALIVELCDGSRSASDIGRLLAPILPEDKSDEVERWIGQALTSGFLSPAALPPTQGTVSRRPSSTRSRNV